ncbi:MAG TPA: response regulator transcription factor [Solirubrobacteraceae bacterium]|nr:response regulator transcription factor [Solirubrobacteraceae bacterium]
MTASLRVHLVERSALRRHGLRAWLQEVGLDVVGESADVVTAASVAARERPDLVIAGIPESGLTLAELLAGLQALPEGTDALLLLDADQCAEAVRAVAEGISVHVLCPGRERDLASAAAGAKQGMCHIATSVLRDWARTALEARHAGGFGRPAPRPDDPRAVDLSPRELQVLREIAEGADNSEIARHLVISENTVKTHVHSILRKLAVENRIQAAVYGVRVGLIERRGETAPPHRRGTAPAVGNDS